MENNTNKPTILVTAGGGGHFAPALAVIKGLQKEKLVDVLFVGRKHGFEGDSAESFEYKTVKDLDIPFETITAGRLQRSLSLRSLVSLFKLPVGMVQAYSLVKRTKPSVIMSFGGYVALPITIAGAMLHVPVIIHEQTMRAGLTNRISGKFAKKICLSFSSSEKYFSKERTIVTGNPLREEILHPDMTRHVHDSLPILFVTGGSLGSHAVNVAIEQQLVSLLEKYQIMHQTGDAQEFQDYDRLVAARERLPEKVRGRYYVTKFVKPAEMAGIMKQSSLVIGRAGINTINELIYFHKPALMIPLPYGQKNEQLENAEYLVSLGLAEILKQEDVTKETMYTKIVQMMDELSRYKLNRDPRTLIHSDAAEKIITIILSYTQKLPA